MRWITALNLEQWADTLAARSIFPDLIADLIRASAENISAFRFPNGDKGQVRGFDGVLDAVGVSPFVPDGTSIWEFGVNGDVIGKANSDFNKRTKEIAPEIRATTTFVFATPRTWDRPQLKIADWLEEKRALNAWSNVEYLDGVGLEHWLDNEPAVAARFARDTLKLLPQAGAYSSDEFWEEFSNRYAPPLAEDVLLAGRESQAEDLVRKLSEGNKRLAYAADSPDEVIAFAIAAIRKAEPEVRAYLESKVLIVDGADSARQLAQKTGLIYMPRGQARGLAGLLSKHGPTVISAGADEQRLQHEVLARPTISALGKALVSMGFTEAEGYDLAKVCGRSLAVLARQRPGGTSELPEWMGSAQVLIPAILAGAWKPSLETDTDVLKSLGGRDKYEEVEEPLRGLTRLKDPPIDKVDDVWTLRSSVDAFLHLGHLIGPEHLQRFAEQATTVFSKVDPPPKAEDAFRLPTKRHDEHSRWLRDGMMTSMLHMAALHEQAKFTVNGSTPQEFVNSIIRSLPGLRTDYRLMVSLRENLPLLAEAAPIPFLEALERLLEGDVEKIRPIFDEHKAFVSSQSFHVELLWALEVLAWDPDLLLRVSLCLAMLAAIDPGGSLSNRPINSLREIFLTWSPHTCATHKQRIGVLKHVLLAVPSISWSLLVKLLPSHHDSASPTQTPRFREAEPNGQETLTYGIVWESQSDIVSLAVQYAGLEPDNWGTLIGVLSQLRPDTFDMVLIELDRCLAYQVPEERTKTWDLLRKETNRHRAFSGVDWALGAKEIEKLDTLVRKFEPADRLLSSSWLFDDWTPDVPEKNGNTDDPMVPIEEARFKALSQVFETGGVAALAALAAKVKLPLQMDVALSKLEISEDGFEELVRRLLSMEGEAKSLATLAVARGFTRFSDRWFDRVREIASELKIGPEATARLFLALEDCRNTWNLIENLGQEIDAKYWNLKHAFRFTGSSGDLAYLMERYTQCGRPMAAIEASHSRHSDVPSATFLKLLDAAVSEINEARGQGATMLGYYLEHVFEELEKRPDVAREELARREFAYLPLFSRRQRPLVLHKLMVEQPEAFMSVIKIVFKPENAEAPTLSPDEQRHATAAYELINGLHLLPGQEGEDVRFEALKEWCVEVRRLADECDRRRITDSRIGHLLAHSPVSSVDHAWPHDSVRKIIEALASDEVERGLAVERFNMRGVYSKSSGEGGKQERLLAKQSRDWASAMPEYPRAAAMLTRIAQTWEQQGIAEDARAAKEALRW